MLPQAKLSTDRWTVISAREKQTRMTLAQFLRRFFADLNQHEIRWCVLRNYDGLPEHNGSDDIDILVDRTQFPLVLRLLASIPQILITDFVRHLHETSVFVGGLEEQGVHLDFTFEFGWKGQIYLEAHDVLRRSRPDLTWPSMRIPDRVDGVLNAVLNTFLSSGKVKAHYRAEASQVLQANKDTAIARISKKLGGGLSAKLIGLFAAGEYEKASLQLSAVRRSLRFREFSRKPLQAFTATCQYYSRELSNRLSGSKITKIATFGPDGVGKTTLIAHLERQLKCTAGTVMVLKFRPNITYKRTVPQPASGPVRPRSPMMDRMLSFVRPAVWCFEHWLYKVQQFSASSELLIFDRYYHDVLIAPSKYHCSVPAARLFAKLVSQADLWLLVDAPPKVIVSRKFRRDRGEKASATIDADTQEMMLGEALAYSTSCRSFLENQANVVLIDGSRDLNSQLARAEAAILSTMAKKTASRLPFSGLRFESAEGATSFAGQEFSE
jgi:thymidylate kinase